MSDKKIKIGDDMLESKIKKNSKKLDISITKLIDRYIRRALFMEDYYNPKPLTKKELIENTKREKLRENKLGIKPQKHNPNAFLRLTDKSD